MKYFIILVVIIILCTLKYYADFFNEKKKCFKRYDSEWGKNLKNEMDDVRRKSVEYYYRNSHKRLDGISEDIDDITWNDLDMDHIFFQINHSASQMGEEVLFGILHKQLFDKKTLEEREKVITLFEENKEIRNNVLYLLEKIGKHKSLSFFEYMDRLSDVKAESNTGHFLAFAAMTAALFSIFFRPVEGLIASVVILTVNVISYLKIKPKVDKYLTTLMFILRLLKNIDAFCAVDNPVLEPYIGVLRENRAKLKKFGRGARIVAPDKVTGDFFDMMLDYLRMAFHIDLIKFNSMLKIYSANKEDFEAVFEIIGYLDAMISVASFRTNKKIHCVPVFNDSSTPGLDCIDLYHPQIEEPVTNSIRINRQILLTGSNASGKSTFIKALAITSILAQTVNTALCRSYQAVFFRTVTSIAPKDSILSGESYYMAEIRSMKRITDYLGEKPVLCFVDEILKGTNTIERIAASSSILSYFSGKNCICVAATHDYELTEILENIYENYHFEEYVENGRVTFDYTLKPGRATSRNAIRLLKTCGYEESIVDASERTAAYFEKNGEWRKLSGSQQLVQKGGV